MYGDKITSVESREVRTSMILHKARIAFGL